MHARQSMRAWLAVLTCAGLSGCGPAPSAAQPASTTPPAAQAGNSGPRATAPIIAMQRARRGGRLVFIDETGARRGDLTTIGPVALRDNSPAWSPDGRWVVFASSRTRADMLATSLWLIELVPAAKPRRLTIGDFDDRDPAWLPDGSGVVFASNRGGTFDLWQLDLRAGPSGSLIPARAPVQLTTRSGHAFHPSPSPDGRQIAYTEADLAAGRSELWVWSPDGARRLTEGPADSTPAWSPDGRRIAFAAAATTADDAPDLDLFVMNADGSGRQVVVAEPLGLQNHPVWSADGRHLFCTTLFRSIESGKPILSSVTYVDMNESTPILRALHDPVVVESRASPALIRGPLKAARLRQNPSYRQALNDAIAQHLIQRELSEER